LNRKEICRLKYDTHKIKLTNRVKGKNLISNLWAQPRFENCARKLATIQQDMNDKTNVFEMSAVVALANFQQKE
jgi:hypothetical protein